MNYIFSIPILFLSCTLTSCVWYPLNLELHSSSILNVDDHHHSLPVVVNVYQLNNNDAFLHSSFDELWTQPKKVLGNSLVDSTIVMLSPHSKKVLHLNRRSETNYIAAIALFRKPSARFWSVCKPLPDLFPIVPIKIIFRLSNNQIHME
jgi:type VI secretion system protein VasD